MSIHPSVARANQSLVRSQGRLRRVVAKVYPIGTKVEVTLGRARVYCVVRGYGWRPQTVVVMNLNTGKVREFSATYPPHDVYVVSRPKAGK